MFLLEQLTPAWLSPHTVTPGLKETQSLMLLLLQPQELSRGEATEGGDALSQHHMLLRENLIIPKWIKAKLL